MFSRTRQEMVIPHLAQTRLCNRRRPENARNIRLSVNSGDFARILGRDAGWYVRWLCGKLTELKQLSRNRDNLSDDFGIVTVSKLYGPIELVGVRMHYECAIFDAAARAQICSVTLLEDIYRLLPKRLRSEMHGPLLATIHKDEQSICQIGMKCVLFSTDPDEVV